MWRGTVCILSDLRSDSRWRSAMFRLLKTPRRWKSERNDLKSRDSEHHEWVHEKFKRKEWFCLFFLVSSLTLSLFCLEFMGVVILKAQYQPNTFSLLCFGCRAACSIQSSSSSSSSSVFTNESTGWNKASAEPETQWGVFPLVCFTDLSWLGLSLPVFTQGSLPPL